jgi:prepilin-type N-terminal cleavage/methylation domain-containing protein
MKNYQTVEGRGPRVEGQPTDASRVSCPRRSSLVFRQAFTLLELLTVIGIIVVIAALLLPVGSMVKQHAIIHATQAQMAQLQTALDRYKSAYGFYPPCNTNNPLINPLYFELLGTTNINGTYQTLDGNTTIPAASVSAAFDGSIGGFINCSKTNADESSAPARDFLPDLRPNQIAGNITNNNMPVTLLVASAGGPDPTYQPLGLLDANPWRYNSANPTNNPGSYDLWIQLKIAGKTNLICNWSKQVQINNPLP